MKKLVSLILVLVLVLSMSITVFAADIEENDGTASSDVTASYVAGQAGGTVISVDIEWYNLSFTYNGESHPVWDPVNHEYTGTETPAGWATSNATITITNHSNAFLDLTLTYRHKEGYEASSMIFTKYSKDFGLMVGNANDGTGEAQSVTIEVVPDGSIPAGTAANTLIGQITVSVSENTDSFNDIYTALSGSQGMLSSIATVTDDPSSLTYGTIYVSTAGNRAIASAESAMAQVFEDDDVDTEAEIQAFNNLINAFYTNLKIKH